MAKLSKTELNRFIENPEAMRDSPLFPLFDAGVNHGEVASMRAALTYRQGQFLEAPGKPEEGTPEYTIMLDIVQGLAEVMRGYIENGQ